MKNKKNTAMPESPLLGRGRGEASHTPILATLSREGNTLVIHFDHMCAKKVREAGHAFVAECTAHSAHHWASSPEVVRLQDFDFFTYGTGQELIDYCSELLAEYLPDETFEFNV